MRRAAVLLGSALLFGSSSSASAAPIALVFSGESIVYDGGGDVGTSTVEGKLFAGGNDCHKMTVITCVPTAVDFSPASLAVRLTFSYTSPFGPADLKATVEQMRLIATIPASLCSLVSGCSSIQSLVVHDPCADNPGHCADPNVAFFADLFGPSIVGLGDSFFTLSSQQQQALTALINIPGIGASNVHFGLAAGLLASSYDTVAGEKATVEITAVPEPATSTLLLLGLATIAARTYRRGRRTKA